MSHEQEGAYSRNLQAHSTRHPDSSSPCHATMSAKAEGERHAAGAEERSRRFTHAHNAAHAGRLTRWDGSI